MLANCPPLGFSHAHTLLRHIARRLVIGWIWIVGHPLLLTLGMGVNLIGGPPFRMQQSAFAEQAFRGSDELQALRQRYDAETLGCSILLIPLGSFHARPTVGRRPLRPIPRAAPP